MIARALKSPYHPVLVHLVPVRRCNLACTYCNEFDNFSGPVPTEEVLRRIDLLAGLGAASIHLSGGEPMLHPDLDQILKRISDHGIFAGLLTNGYLLTPERIQRFNRAGLDHLQISVDNVLPDDVSKKSLKVLDQKLRWLSQYAEFHVNINSVVGSSIRSPEDAVVVAQRAVELGLSSTVGIIHDHSGQLRPLEERQQAAYEEVMKLRRDSFSTFSFYNQFQKNLTQGLPNQWHCRAGSRYLYICEDGLVHYCSQQRGYPAIPLQQYTKEHLEREYRTVKPCAPYCTISCVHRVSMIDQVREKPLETLQQFFPPRDGRDPHSSMPIPVRMLAWLFMPGQAGTNRKIFRKAVARLLGV
jgi:MoaA/NifB/PqqE/SkfB family radical SAM enzyme